MTTAWAYIRVSSDKQAQRGLPVQGQREAIQQYAEANGMRVERWYIDEAKTGTNDHREQFQAMVSDARKHAPDGLVILMWAWNRFARDFDDALYYKADLRRRGIEIVPTNGEVPRDLPRAVRNILEAVVHMQDENASAEISRNTMRGKATLAAAGYIPTGSKPPPGYRVQFEEAAIGGRRRRARRWVPDPETWPLARRAWDMRLAGATYQEIWDAWPIYKAPNYFGCFFANTAYKGQVHASGAVIEVEPMVTPEEWRRVNANKSNRRSGAYARRKTSTFLLSGLAVCARCGTELWGGVTSAHTDKRGYYHQSHRQYQCPRRVRYGGCDLPRMSANRLERAVIQTLLDEVLTEENLQAQAAAIEEQRDAERPALEAQLVTLGRELEHLDQSIANLLDVIETGNSSASVARRLAEREEERDQLREQIADVRARLSGVDQTPIDLPSIREALQSALDSGPPATVRALLAQFVAEVRVDTEEVTIRYHYPFASSTDV